MQVGISGEDAKTCLNFGTSLAGHYCHGCGRSSHIARTLGGFATFRSSGTQHATLDKERTEPVEQKRGMAH